MDSKTKENIKRIISKNRVLSRIYKGFITLKLDYDFEKRRRYKGTSRIRRLKSTKERKRCFIIGNGPSLTINDLEKLLNEDTFAVNRIYQIFDKTSWRPTYYVSQDRFVANDIKDDLDEVVKSCQHIFLNSCLWNVIKPEFKKQNVHFIFLNDRDRDGDFPFFSDDICEQIYEGNTVTYACIQIAVYMGYSEIYIIGVDHNYARVEQKDGTIIENVGVRNYMPGLEGKQGFLPALDRATLAYQRAKQICDERGIVIRNATRGGKLEEFIRVDLDEIV